MDWHSLCGNKLVTPQQAIALIKPTDTVYIAGIQATPFVLCQALVEQKEALRGLCLNTLISFYNWDIPGITDFFRLESWYLSRRERGLMHKGGMDYIPVSCFRAESLPHGLDALDVYMVSVSPPDRHGYCSYGTSVGMSPLMAQRADRVIAEIDPSFIRTGGENYIHISAIDRCVERPPTIGPPTISPEVYSQEKQDAIDTICMSIVNELIQDGETIQIGAGDMTSPLPAYMYGKNDLGMQTEIIPPGVIGLIQAGVLTGKNKTRHTGIVVGTGFHPMLSPEELDFIDGNPVFELYDFNYTDDIRLLCQDPHFTAINNALSIDLTGQVASESIGPQQFTGTGGQTAFCVAASLAGSKSIIALPSSSLLDGRRISRIVPTLAPGTVVTTPRAFVDFVVTEYGIATLCGKSLRERARELSAVAHPDFRDELKEEAGRLHGLC